MTLSHSHNRAVRGRGRVEPDRTEHTPTYERRPVPGFSGIYADSNGRLWRGDDLAQTFVHSRNGYLSINARRDSNRQWVPLFVHRAVALAFHGVPAAIGLQSRHLDGDRSNNRPDNLAWGTQSQNYWDSVAHGTAAIGEKNGCARLTLEQVRAMRRRLARLCREIAAETGVHHSTVRAAITDVNWHTAIEMGGRE